MKREDIEQQVRQFVVTKGEITDEFTSAMTFRQELDIDSLQVLEIVVATEHHFAIKIEENDYPEFNSVDGAVRLVEKALSEK